MKPMNQRPGTLRFEPSDPTGESIGRAVRKKFRPVLLVLVGEPAEVGNRITVDGNILLGRDTSADVSLSDPGVSWRHAVLEDRGGNWAVVDLGSTNGTHVNGVRVPEAPLDHGDKIRIGRTVLRFEVQDEIDEAFTKHVADLINIDDLTGLFLRRRFDAELAVMLARAEAGGTRLALLAMDLDGIKTINDTHGHLFGAYTISEAGKRIGRIIGEHGVACRFGGDEFFAALPGHDLEQATRLAEQIREGICEHAFAYEGVRLDPTVSIGAAVFPDSGNDPKSLFQAADEALYRAKRAGKNRVCT